MLAKHKRGREMSAPSKPRGWVVRTPEGYVGPRGGRVSAQAKAKRHRTEDAARAAAAALPGAEVVPMRSTPRRGIDLVPVPMPDALREQIEAAAGKGNRSAWIREACEMRLVRDREAGIILLPAGHEITIRMPENVGGSVDVALDRANP